MADRDRSFSARLGRALLPLGLVFLVAWFIVTVYGFFAGELEARPLTVLGSIGTFLIILSVIGQGWYVRRSRQSETARAPEEIEPGSGLWPLSEEERSATRSRLQTLALTAPREARMVRA